MKIRKIPHDKLHMKTKKALGLWKILNTGELVVYICHNSKNNDVSAYFLRKGHFLQFLHLPTLGVAAVKLSHQK